MKNFDGFQLKHKFSKVTNSIVTRASENGIYLKEFHSTKTISFTCIILDGWHLVNPSRFTIKHKQLLWFRIIFF